MYGLTGEWVVSNVIVLSKFSVLAENLDMFSYFSYFFSDLSYIVKLHFLSHKLYMKIEKIKGKVNIDTIKVKYSYTAMRIQVATYVHRDLMSTSPSSLIPTHIHLIFILFAYQSIPFHQLSLYKTR